MREIRTYGLMRGKSHRRQRRGVGLYSTRAGVNPETRNGPFYKAFAGSVPTDFAPFFVTFGSPES